MYTAYKNSKTERLQQAGNVNGMEKSGMNLNCAKVC